MRAPDLYATLGVPRGATTAEIKHAYRRRSTTEHPDKGGPLGPWQEISAAYNTLSDPEKRRAYDQQLALASCLELLRGVDLHEQIGVPFLLALHGGHVQHGGLQLRIPSTFRRSRGPAGPWPDSAAPTVAGGLVLRLRERGGQGFPNGDLLLSVSVDPHPHLRLDPDQPLGLLMDVPVTLLERYQGGPLVVPTPWGPFYLRFPAGSLADGEVVVLRGFGIRCACPPSPRCACEHGDLKVVVRLQLPPPDVALLHVLDRLQGGQLPRASLEAALKED